jgi:hypothetical protein
MHLLESQDAGNGLIHKHLRASQGRPEDRKSRRLILAIRS